MPSDRSYYQRISELVDRTITGIPAQDRAAPERAVGKIVKRVLVGALLFVLVLGGMAFAVDYFVLRLRMAFKNNPFDTVTVQRVYYMRLKNGKTEITPGETENQTCVHSLFPHLGDGPCWYVTRHTEKRIDM